MVGLGVVTATCFPSIDKPITKKSLKTDPVSHDMMHGSTDVFFFRKNVQ